MGYIYMLIDKRNGKKYIGKHNGGKKDYWSSGLVPNRIAKKHGKKIFERFILEDKIPDDILNEREIFYIKEHDSFNNGYNATIGGEGGGHWIYNKTEAEIKKIAEIKSKKLTGRVFSEETLRKMSDSGKIKVFTKGHRENIGKAMSLIGGHPSSEEKKEKHREFMTGRKNPEHGNFMRENNPKAQKVSILGVIYLTIKEACEKLEITRPVMKYRLNSKSDKFKNWIKIK